jgi:Uma2 family endonuclease
VAGRNGRYEGCRGPDWRPGGLGSVRRPVGGAGWSGRAGWRRRGEAIDAGVGGVYAGERAIQFPRALFVAADRRSIIGPLNVTAAPDLVILSPGDPDHDRERKYGLYARYGVSEYWMVDPAERTIDVFTLAGGAYTLATHAGPGDVARSPRLAGFAAVVDEVLPAGG